MKSQLKVTFGSCDICFMGYFGHKIRWCYMPDRLMSLSEAVSEGQVKVRSQKINFENYKY